MRLYKVHGWRFVLQESSSISSALDDDEVSEATATTDKAGEPPAADIWDGPCTTCLRSWYGKDKMSSTWRTQRRITLKRPLRRSLIFILKRMKVTYLSLTRREEIEQASSSINLGESCYTLSKSKISTSSSTLCWCNYRTANIYFRAHTGEYAKCGYINKYCWGFSDYWWDCLLLLIMDLSRSKHTTQRQALELWLPCRCLKRQLRNVPVELEGQTVYILSTYITGVHWRFNGQT